MLAGDRVRVSVEDLTVLAASTALVVLLGRLEGHGEVVLTVGENSPQIRIDLSGRPSFAEVSRRIERALPTEDRLRAALVQAGLELRITTSDVEIIFDRERFTRERISELGEQLRIVVAALRATPDEPIDACALVTPHARAVLPDPTTLLDAPVQEPIERALVRLASSSKADAATEWRGAVWSFGELDARATALAAALRERGIIEGDRVIVTGQRCPAVVAAIVAVWKCGAVIVPVSDSLPEQRREVMAREANAVFALVVGSEGNDPSLPTLRVSETDASPIRASGVRTSRSVPSAGPDAAYVFFTSGTTGTPKGIVGTHQGLAHFLTWQRRRFEVGLGDRAAQLTGLSFDVVMRDMFTPLSAGATLCFPERDAASMDPDRLLAWLRDQRITLMHSVPSVLESWLTSWRTAPSIESLRLLFMAGEPLTGVLVRRIREQFRKARIVNLYGPTETTLAKCFHEVSGDPSGGIQPVGHAIPGAQAFVLNAAGTRGGIGETGEIVIRTPFRTLGYLGGEARGGKFRPNPFRDDERDLVYFTGDRGRHRLDGDLEILGRVDDQVKIHGVRVEPAEVSATLRTHADVLSCFVGAITEPGRPTSLCAWVVLDASARRDSDTLRRYLADRLVAAMVPASFVFLEKLPLSPNGKVDRKALPPPTTNDARPHVAPRTPAEETLAEIWRTVLGLERVGVDESFFELGGHSLSATQLAAQVRRRLHVELPMRALFDHPTIAQLAGRIAELAPTASEPALGRVRRDAPLPLSSSEARLWFLDQLEPGRATYNLHRVVSFRGAIDEGALERALAELVARHETLRTRYQARAGEPLRIIDPAPDRFPLERITSPSDTAGAIAREVRKPFDLEKGPLFRAALLAIGNDEHVLALSMHHIVSDGWSLEIIERELALLYASHRDGRASALPDLPIQYADYAAWQREWMSTDAMRRQLDYWTEHLRGATDTLDLPTDRARPARRRELGGTVRLRLPADVATKVAELARRQECAPFMVLFAAFNVLLHRLTRQEDLVVGVPIANRARPELGASWGEGVVGFLVNTLAMRTRLDAQASFREIVARVKESALDAYEHQDVPFELLVDALRIARDTSRTPLFQVMFAHETDPLVPSKAWGTNASIEVPDLGIAKFDLRLQTEQLADGLGVSLEFDSDLFDVETAVRLVSRYATLLDSALRAPDERIGSLVLLTEEERRRVVVDFNATRTELPTRRAVHEIFEERVSSTPDAIAIELGDASLTYRELDDRADELAQELLTRGARGRVVAVVMDRSLEMVIALYATLKAGAAYAPLDPSHPRERLQFMVGDLDAPVILSAGRAASSFAESSRLLRVEAGHSEKRRARRERIPVRDEDLAYLIYTSGSTGKPKGVMNTHEGLRNRLLWMQAAYGLGASDAVLQKTPYTFDVSVWEFFWPLMVGARLVIARPEGHRDPQYLADVIRAARITTLHFVPSMLEAFLESADVAQCKTLKRVICSGEALPAKLVDRFHERLPWCELHNLYGPTEASIDVTFWQCRPEDRRDDIPIGAPIFNTQMYVVDSEGAPSPIGVPGELCIAGIGLARGYWRRPDLTGDRFVPNPFAPEPGARMYRTGDLARWSRDGNLQYLGRLDHQVKLRGLRIELGEIEHALLAQPGIRAAVVLAREDRPGDKRLVAYVTSAGDARPSPDDLRRAVGRVLPEYMVPSAFVLMDALPLSANGKIDRKLLPAPDAPARADADEPPIGATEEAIAATFASVLGLERVGRNDDFFDLGGHSLLATRLIARLREQLRVELPLRIIFEARMVAALAEHVTTAPRTALAHIEPAPADARLALSFAEARLWFLEQYDPGTSLYNVTRLLRLRGALDQDALALAIGDLVERHESLRTRFTSEGGSPRRVVDPPGPPPLVEGRTVEDELHRGFDLARGPLFRAALVRLSSGEPGLLLAMHHVVTDGWSMDVLIRELASAYDARRSGRPPVFAPLPIQYADYAAWQRDWLASGTLERQLGYWKEQLRGAPASLDLPTDRPRPNVKSQRGATLRFDLTPEVARGVRALAQAEGATPFMILLAAFDVLLARHADIDDVVVGTPVAGRKRPEIEGVVGFFVNTLVIRTKLDGRPTFREVVRRAKRAALDAFDHQDIPFERLVEELNPARDPSRTPVIQIVFAFETTDPDGVLAAGLEHANEPLESATSKFDLTLTVNGRGEELAGALEYDSQLFDHDTVARIAERYCVLLHAAVSTPDRLSSELPLMSAAEKQRVLIEWNASPKTYPRDRRLDDLVIDQAVARPDALAVTDDQRTLTYGELARRSRSIANALVARGVRRGDIVALRIPRGVNAVVAMLGVLRSGAAYLPLDTEQPEERLRYMLSDSRARITIVDGGDEDAALDGYPVVAFEALLADQPAAMNAPPSDVGDVAYVIYTSGSTGQPKGACIAHDTITWLAREQSDAAASGRPHRRSQFASLSFDAHVWEVWPALISGGSVHFVPDALRADPASLIEWLARERIEWAFVPTALAELCLRSEWPVCALKTLAVGGDRLHEVPDVSYPFALLNGYGPTECTCVTTSGVIRPGDRQPGIGRPLGGVCTYILDDLLEPVPIGQPGELYVGGSLVGRGYLGRTALTADRFVPDPFSNVPGSRMYATGDLARWRADGTIEFIGRDDGQVKVRGFRIEIGEIESALVAASSVSAAAVIAHERAPGDKRLVAYLVPATDRIDVDEVARELRRTLPEYMVPSAFVVLDAFPLTSSGKVDRKALPAPDFAATATDYVAPRTSAEKTIANTFAEILGAPRVGIHDDFFALGGHSLLATRVASRLRSALRVDVPVRVIFECPSVARLAERLGGAKSAVSVSEIPRVVRGAPLEASYAQERLWFLDQLDPGQPTYNVPLVLRLRGDLDEAALERSLSTLVARHESLRTTFVEAEGRPQQIIHSSMRVPLERVVDPKDIVARPFDLTKGPLVRAGLSRVGAGEHLFSLVLHHVVTDGASMQVLERELAASYAALSHGESPALDAMPIQYADFAAWQRGWLSSGVLESQLAHWKRALHGAPAALELPTDFPRPATKQHRGSQVRATIGAEIATRVSALAREEAATPFMVLFAAFSVLLARHTGQRDLVIGTPVEGRTRSELDSIVGFFVNTLALRISIEGEPSFRDVVRRVKRAALDAFEQQDVPFEKIVEALNPPRDTSRTPIFQAMFSHRAGGSDGGRLGALDFQRETVALDTAKFDLVLSTVEGDGGIEIELEYDVALFERATAARMIERFVAVLTAAMHTPQARASRLALMTDRERGTLLDEWSGTEVSLPNRFVPELFADQAERTPDAVAIGGADVVTYRELLRRVRALAAVLRARGVGPDVIVGVCVERSTFAVVALLAVLEAGAAYLPLEPTLPDARLRWLVDDAGVSLVLTTQRLGDRASATGAETLRIDIRVDEATFADAGSAPIAKVNRDSLAYVIYTSGSTGQPKGVMVSHGGFAVYLAEAVRRYGGGLCAPLHSSLAFDLTVTSLFLPLTTGGYVTPVPDADVDALAGALARDPELTLIKITPAHLELLAAHLSPQDLARPRIYVIGGEALLGEMLEPWRRQSPRSRFINEYGPTETVVGCAIYEVVETTRRAGAVPIGRPLHGTQIYVLDHDLQPTPLGVPGELYIGGAQITRGYLRRAGLTAERFVPDPFTERPGARLYRTGDLVRWLHDGNLEYLDRVDRQVKVRGYRIELGEIESALRAVPGIREVAVLARQDAQGTKRLVAYVVASAGEAASIDELRAALARALPEYMVPSAFVSMDALPINENGKVDRKALPAPDFAGGAAEFVAPRTPVEKTIADIFADVLGATRVGIHDDFFALGGHSLLATRVASRLRVALRVEAPVRLLFECPSVARLAERLGGAKTAATISAIPRVDRGAPLEASYAQERLWFLEQLDPGQPTYNVPLVLRLRGALDEAALERSLSSLVARHESLRTTFAEIEGRPLQIIHPAMRVPLERDVDPKEIVARPFDLANGPLVRAGLSRVGRGEHLFSLVLHHVVTDGASMQVLERELATSYAGIARGEWAVLDAMPIQYADFAAWQRVWLASGVLTEQLAYWKQTLAGAPAALELFTDLPRPATKQHRGSRVRAAVDEDVATRVAALAREEAATPFMVLLAAFYVFLARHTGQRDLVVGTPVEGRTRPELDSIVGFFVNTLALRVSVDDEPSFRDVLRRVKKAALDAFEHQDVPFEKIVETLNPPRDTSRTPIFQAMFSHRAGASDDGHLGELHFRREPVALDSAKFDLVLSTAEANHGIDVELEYDVALFERATAARMVERFVTVLTAAMRAPEQRASRLALASDRERRTLLDEWSGTEVDSPTRFVPELFADQAERTPDAVAIGGADVVTYRDLLRRVKGLAAVLRARGVGPDVIVGVCVERSTFAVIALLAVLEAGAAYLPLEPTLPDERLRWLASDALASLVLTTKNLADRANATGIELLCIDDPVDEAIPAPDARAPIAKVNRDSLAYVIYTSGSTGQPKGVMVSHGGFAVYLAQAVHRYGGGLCAPLHSSLAFDLTVTSLFLPLTTGGYVTPVPNADVDALAGALARDPELTLVKITPAHLELLAAHLSPQDLARPRIYVIGGEALLGEMLEPWRRQSPGSRFINEYGPTETVVGCAIYEVIESTRRAGAVPIGKPLHGTKLYVLDRDLQPTPLGVPGELYIGGAQITRGYLRRPGLCAERFIPDPFTQKAGARLYRTGDLVRWLDDGNLEYLDRVDRQVKVRGYRIELGEIESALRAIPGIRDVAVLARQDAQGTKRIVAYVVASAGETASIETLRATIARVLPEYMLPSAFVSMNALPINENGKVDRKALPAPDFTGGAAEYVAPRTSAENTIAESFAEILGAPRVGIHDDFFALGGHSLLATRVVSRIRSALGIEVPVRLLFEAPTVARLAERLSEMSKATQAPLVRIDRSAPSPASFAQARLWFLDQFEGGASATYNVPTVLRLTGPVNTGVLERAVQALVDRHEGLRTTFVAIDGVPHQVVGPSTAVRITRIQAASEQDARVRAERQAHAPFDLAKGPLFRASLVRIRDDAHLFVLCIHHIVTDGWSMGVLERELSALYTAFSKGKPSPLAASSFDYPDFAAWQRGILAGDALLPHLAFWKTHLEGAPAALELPTDRPRPAVKQYAGATVPFVVPSVVTQRLRALCRREGVTPFMVLLSAYQCVLARWSGQNDVVVGTVIANRTRQELESIVGFFVNTLATRARFAHDTSFVELLRHAKRNMLSAFAHQDVPFEKLVEELGAPRDTSRTPVFQASFVLQNNETARIALPNIEVEQEESIGLAVSKFDITLAIAEEGEQLRGQVQYDVALFDGATIERFAQHFGTFLDGATRSPEERIATIPLMSDAEKQRVLFEWNASANTYRRDRRLDDLVMDQAATSPEAVAVVDERRSVTYDELAKEALTIAGALAARGVGRGDVVALCLPRGVNAVAAMLGVLRAGAAYLPIDPEQPPERIGYMLSDSRARITIVDRVRDDFLAGIAVVPFAALLAGERRDLALSAGNAADVAYVIYTSGSTGQPKGACIAHETITWLAQEQRDAAASTRTRRRSQFASLAFDAHVWELWPALISGGSIHFVPEEVRTDPAGLIAWLARERIEWSFVPTAIAELCLRSPWPACDLKVLTVAGDRLHEVPDAAYPFALLNAYGPTECTCATTAGVIAPGDLQPDIGRPLGGVRTYLLDDRLEPVPIGQPGELYVGGALVGRGYLRRMALTADKFVPDPFTSERGARMYRTGDLARWRANGTIDFIGRRDHQVKIRGFRIELGEVEAALRAITGVTDVVVVAHDDRLGTKQLVAYVVTSAGVETLQRELGRTLPDYMVPSIFVRLDALPLNSSGKVDRKALPAPDFTVTAAEYVAPRTEVERQLCEIFASTLSLERAGIHDDFFALGGHSLLATRLVSRIRAALEIELPVRALFDSPTVAQLTARVGEMSAAPSTREALRRVDRNAPMPASFAQARLWFLDRLEGGASATYNVPLMLRSTGRLDASVLERAVQELVRRHEGLRTTFVAVGGVPHQIVHPAIFVPLARFDADSDEAARFIAVREAQVPFDLAAGPLVRAALVRIHEDAHLFVLCIHHIVTDGWSMGVLQRELSALYAAFLEGRPSPLPASNVDYPDFAAWQRAALSKEALAPQLAFWKAYLEGAPTALELPTDRARPAVKQYVGASVHLVVPSAVVRNLRALCRREGVTSFMALLAAYQCVLSRWSGQTDIVVGTVIANRTRQELESIVGFFVNTLAMRATIERETSFVELLRHVKHAALSAFAHQDVPFEKLVEELGVPRDTSRTPVFQASFVLQNNDPARVNLPGLRVQQDEAFGLGVAKFDITLAIAEVGEELRGELEYDVALFDRATIERFAEHFGTFLDAALRLSEERVATLPLMSDAEKRRVLVEWNATAHDIGPIRTVHGMFEARAKQTPDVIAVEFEDQRLTYGELDEHADRVAQWLVGHGVCAGDCVAVEVRRSHEMLSALLGVMKAGAAYVPIDGTLPDDRKRFMKEDAKTSAVLDDAALREALSSTKAGSSTRIAVTPEHLAYVLYTSGSTGRPKGVMVAHGSVANLLASLAHEPGIDPDETTLSLTTLSFDVSVAELFLPLVYGARVVIASREAARDPQLITEIIATTGARTFGATPATWRMMVESGWRPTAGMEIHCAGEALPRPLADSLTERGATLWNLYGPTETTVYASGIEVHRDAPITIGRPLRNTQLYVVDDALRPVPIGVTGELCIAGAGVALGYLGRRELTAEKFVPDPFSSERGARMYRTGDLARWRADGTIDFLGRRDHQVKVRGFRIELGEIEAALRAVAGVTDCVVVTREDRLGGQQLIGYVVSRVDVEALKRELLRTLPDYMVPAAFVVLDALPLTPTGKVDRKALPAPDFAAAAEEYVPARTPTEQVIAELFAEVLGADRVGVHDDFFALGGHSLLVAKLVAAVHNRLDVAVPLATFFKRPTVEHLAAAVDAGRGVTGTLLKLREGDERAAIVLIAPVGGKLAGYFELIGSLGDVHVVGLRALGLAPGESPHESIEIIAAEHVATLRASHPGPYALAGWSFGGVLAYEMARMLVADGATIAEVVAIDSYPGASDSLPTTETELLLGFFADLSAPREAPTWATATTVRPEELWQAAMEHGLIERDKISNARRAFDVYRANVSALSRYRPAPAPVDVHWLRAKRAEEENPETVTTARGTWAQAAHALAETVVDADHYSIVRPPAAAEVVQAILTARQRLVR